MNLNSQNLSFNQYLMLSKNNFKKDGIEHLECKYIDKGITDFYQSTQCKQGIIGKFWNKLKEKLEFKTSKENTDLVLKDYKKDINNLEKEQKAIAAVNNYAKSQHSATNITRNFVASGIASGLCSLFCSVFVPKNIKSKAICATAAALVGSAGAIITKKADAKTAKREYKKSEKLTDKIFSAIPAALSAVGTMAIPSLLGKKLKPVQKFFAKRIFSTALGGLSVFSLIKLENIIYSKFLNKNSKNPAKKTKLSDKYKKQKKKDEYQFYNPRTEITNKYKKVIIS